MEIIKAKAPKIKGTGRPLKYPFDKLKKGEALTLSKEDNAISAGTAARQYAKAKGMKLVTRTVNGTTTIYRTK
jgi:hypothetical protein